MSTTSSSGLSSPMTSPSELLDAPLSPFNSDLLDVPSSPLSSLRSRSPSPPPGFRFYNTPPPSQDAGEDMPRPRKRRKIEKQDRTTQTLNLLDDDAQSIYDRNDAIQSLQHALRSRKKIVVIAGAGISVSAGIPDFRSANGLFAGLQKEHKLKGGSGKQLFDASVYKDGEATSQFHDMVRKLSKMSKRAKPTAFHEMVARLATEGRLLRLYTQNVDGLETQMPPLATEVPLPHKGPWPQTVQLHGGLEKMMCQKCRAVLDFDSALFEGADTPTCPECRQQDTFRTDELGKRSHGIGRLRPRIVLYNEQNPDEEAIGAVSAADMRTRPDAIVVVGTSMKIPGVRRIVSEMCKIVRDRREGTTIWINPDPEPTGPTFDNCWDLIVKGGSDTVAELVNLRQWNDPSTEETSLPTDEIEIEKIVQVIKKPDISDMTPPRSRAGESTASQQDKISPRLKLHVGSKSREAEEARLKLTEIQVNIPPAIRVDVPAISKMKNPVSGGRKMTDVLGKENIAKNRNSIATKKRRPAKKNNQQSLNEMPMKVSKVSKARITVKQDKSDNSAGRNRAPLDGRNEVQQQNIHSTNRQHPSTSQIMKLDYIVRTAGAGTPGLTSSTNTPEESPAPQTPPATTPTLQRSNSSQLLDTRTISPKSIPRGMEALID